MPGNEEINRIGIELYIDDKTPEGLSSAQSHALASSEKFGSALNSSISASGQKAAGSLYQVKDANDKLSDSLTKATNIREHASRSIGRMAEMFNPFNLAVGAAIVGIGALGAKMYNLAAGPFNEAVGRFKELNKEMDEFTKSMNDWLNNQFDALSTLTDNEKKRIEIQKQLRDAYEAARQIEVLAAQESHKASLYLSDSDLVRLERQARVELGYEQQVDKIDELMGQLGKLNELERLQLGREMGVMAEPKKGGGGGGVKKGTEPESAGNTMAGGMFSQALAGLPSIDEAMNYASSYIDVIQGEVYGKLGEMDASWTETARANLQYRLDAEKMSAQAVIDLAEFKYQSVEDIERQLTASHKAQVQEFMANAESVGGTISSITQTVGKVAAAAIKDEKKRMKATAAITAIMESIQAAVEIAKAIGAYPDPVGMAAHAASAVAHVAAAVLAAKYGGGGATTPNKSAAGAGAAAGAVAPAGETTKSTMSIVVYGHIFSPEGGAGFVRQAGEAALNQRNPGRERTEMV